MSKFALESRCCVLMMVVALAAGCGSGSGDGGLESRPLEVDSTPAVATPLTVSVALLPGEMANATIYDQQNGVVFHRSHVEAGEFTWTPYQAGEYLVRVDIQDARGPIAFGDALLQVPPRGGPMLTNTSHPLVALYTYEIPLGHSGNVSYTCTSCMDTIARSFETPILTGTGAETAVLLPGLRPNSTYTARHTLYDEFGIVDRGPELSISTGDIPIELTPVAVNLAPANPELNALLGVSILGRTPQIVDEQGVPVWYGLDRESLMRPTGNGWGVLKGASELRVLDHSGQTVRSLTVDALNLQLADLGLPPTLTIHHENRPIPNNRFVTFGQYERILTDVQGPGDVNVLADTVIVLDDRMRVVWFWDAFEHLDTSRMAQLGDITEDGDLGIDLQLGDQANDWTHMNSIDYDPRDGNLVLSVRHLSWVIKIAYEDGRGDGHVVWRLGEGGDFTIVSDDPSPWFTYPHDANVLEDGRLAVYDNGNVRVTNAGTGNSRGQVYLLDEANRIAMLDVNIDLGVYSFFLGSAALTPDGSYHFNSGAHGLHESIADDGVVHSSFQTVDAFTYRSFKMSDPFDTSAN